MAGTDWQGRIIVGAKRRKFLLAYIAFCTLLLVGLRGRAWQHVNAINMGEWEPIETWVRQERQEGEPVAFVPSWTRGSATDLYKFRGVDMVDEPRLAWSGEGDPPPGLWVVSQFGAFDPADVPEERFPHRYRWTIGGAEVFLFRQSAGEVNDSLALHGRDVECALHGFRDEPIVLEWRRVGYYLPTTFPDHGRFNFLNCRTNSQRIAGRRRLGLWFHPPLRGQHLTATFSDQELKPWLLVEGGLADSVAHTGRAAVNLEVRVNGESKGSLSFPSQRGWRRFARPTGASSGRGQIQFSVSSPNNHSRHFLFNASLHRERPSGATLLSETE
jgi:hypothetical protein